MVRLPVGPVPIDAVLDDDPVFLVQVPQLLGPLLGFRLWFAPRADPEVLFFFSGFRWIPRLLYTFGCRFYRFSLLETNDLVRLMVSVFTCTWVVFERTSSI